MDKKFLQIFSVITILSVSCFSLEPAAQDTPPGPASDGVKLCEQLNPCMLDPVRLSPACVKSARACIACSGGQPSSGDCVKWCDAIYPCMNDVSTATHLCELSFRCCISCCQTGEQCPIPPFPIPPHSYPIPTH